MVYTIEYIKDGKTHVLYDIEVFLEIHEGCWDEKNSEVYDAWRTELHCTCFGEGIAAYVYDRIDDEETLKKFEDACSHMSFLRGFLHEQHYNQWLHEADAKQFFYNLVGELELIIETFALEWGLKIKK